MPKKLKDYDDIVTDNLKNYDESVKKTVKDITKAYN